MGNSWNGLVILLLCFGPRSEPMMHLLETVSFGDFDNGARCFFDKWFYFFAKHGSKNVASVEQLPRLQLPKLPFPENPWPKEHLLFHTPHGIHSLFGVLPNRPHCQVSHQGQLSHSPKKWFSQLWLVPGHTFSQGLLQFQVSCSSWLLITVLEF